MEFEDQLKPALLDVDVIHTAKGVTKLLIIDQITKEFPEWKLKKLELIEDTKLTILNHFNGIKEKYTSIINGQLL